MGAKSEGRPLRARSRGWPGFRCSGSTGRTRDATNSFKAYSASFVREVGIESDGGFEVGIELVAKACRLRRPVAEIPTIWLEREAGTSNFQLTKWLPNYLRWYFHAFGSPPLDRAGRREPQMRMDV